MLRIRGRRTVANVQKVLWCLGEIGVDFDYEDAPAEAADGADAAYLAQKNAGSAPVMDEDGFVLWEGNAIVRYLARKYAAGTLWPADPREEAEADRWMDYQLSTIRESLHPLLRGTPDAVESARLARSMAGALAVVDAALAGRDYLAGARFTVADIPVAITVYRWRIMDIERPALANIETWYRRIAARAAFRAWVVPPADPFTAVREAGEG